MGEPAVSCLRKKERAEHNEQLLSVLLQFVYWRRYSMTSMELLCAAGLAWISSSIRLKGLKDTKHVNVAVATS